MAMQTDPVCKTKVDDQKTATTSQYQGMTYCFCSPECKRKFDQQPQQYASAVRQGQSGAQSKGSGGGRY